MKKGPLPEKWTLCFDKAVSQLAENDCFAGANACASAAFNASVGVNNIDRAFRNSFYGTFGKTGSASYTAVSNNVSHSFILLKIKG